MAPDHFIKYDAVLQIKVYKVVKISTTRPTTTLNVRKRWSFAIYWTVLLYKYTVERGLRRERGRCDMQQKPAGIESGFTLMHKQNFNLGDVL